MSKNKLVIVESPNKVKTIQKYLGSEYKVMASVGHIVDMPAEGEMNLGIDFKNWEPIYKIAKDKVKTFKNLKEQVEKAEIVYIATDPDREGEAIGENLVNFLKIKNKYKRIKYNEITKDAILKSIENASFLDLNLVEAQKTRRMLDRIIGFRLTNLISSKIQNSLTRPTAGRVQSIALKLVVERDKEIDEFTPIPYSTIEAIVNDEIKAKYFNLNSNDFESKEWVQKQKALEIVDELSKEKKLKIVSVESIQKESSKIEPLKQSVLYKKSPLSAKATKESLQRLFEGFGEYGLITYPRTDSTRIATEFILKANEYIVLNYGLDFVNKKIKSSSGEQDAHEAIRPTDMFLTPSLAKEKYQLNNDDFKIYSIIWETTIKALMKPPIKDTLNCELESNSHKFKMSFSKTVFLGYEILNPKENENELPTFKEGNFIDVKEFKINENQTKPPSKYSDGSLIDKLDKIKVGRPSTFATTVDKIQERKFVIKTKDKLSSTIFGQEVLNKLIIGFPNEINENYTAQVEADLDLIAEGKKIKNEVMKQFWNQFKNSYEKATQTLQTTYLEDKRIKEDCPNCSSKLAFKFSKMNKEEFIGCTNYPSCKFTKSIKNTKQKRR